VCLVEVEQPADLQLLERDSRQGLDAHWTVQPVDEGRCVIGVEVSWPSAEGRRAFLRRARQRLAVRAAYEQLIRDVRDSYPPLQVDTETYDDDPTVPDTDEVRRSG
jgi:hypothetical protein